MRSNLGKMDRLGALAETDDTRPVILAVGEVSGWRERGHGLPMDSQITFVEFHEISLELLETVRPDLVLSPVMCSSFDCLDLAQVLGSFGFSGRYRAMVGGMPNPELVRREIQSHCPHLDFDLISITLSPSATLN